MSWIVWRKETGTFCTMTRAAVYLVTLHVACGGHSVGTVPAAVCSDIPKIALKAPKKKITSLHSSNSMLLTILHPLNNKEDMKQSVKSPTPFKSFFWVNFECISFWTFFYTLQCMYVYTFKCICEIFLYTN